MTNDVILSNNRGIILLAALLMLVALIGITLICAFPLVKEVDDEIRRKITIQKIKEIKRAFFGRIAEKEGGEDINSSNSACGGFLSDFGMPSDGITGRADPFGTANFLDVLLRGNEVIDPEGIGWKKWHYDPDKKFWAGYRGEYYLVPNSFDRNGNPQFVDGWGNAFEVVLSSCGHWMRIKSLGEDGKEGGEDYATDIVEKIYNVAHDEKILIDITNKSGRSVILDAGIVYPLFGGLKEKYSGEPKEIGSGGTGQFQFQFSLDDRDDATGPATGTCKIVLQNQTNGAIQTKTVCFPNTGTGPVPRETRIEVEYDFVVDYNGRT